MTIRLSHPDRFVNRHLGPSDADRAAMLKTIGAASIDQLVAETVPDAIRMRAALRVPDALNEVELLTRADELASKNQVWRSYIGAGYHDCVTPAVILRNIIENPAWYTQYTPYQAEISQGRLEALLNFQTVVSDLTGLPIANASLLDEATAAAEAMYLAHASRASNDVNAFVVCDGCHPQVIDVVRTRAEAIGAEVVVTADLAAALDKHACFGVLVQYPTTDGEVCDFRALAEKTHAAKALFIVAADILSLSLLTPPGEFGADVCVGSTQRFGVPLGYGGPHAAFFACTQEHVRKLPGRIIGVSVDAQGKRALRMALQTREQHIRRERATSNICTAQALLAITASMYAVYHGPEGIKAIGEYVASMARMLQIGLQKAGIKVVHEHIFDTVCVEGTAEQIAGWHKAAADKKINLRRLSATRLAVALDERSHLEDVADLYAVFGVNESAVMLSAKAELNIPSFAARKSAYLQHDVFTRYHSETEMLRYMKELESRDLSLAHSMIPLGSCTMKLNATAEMIPVTDRRWNGIHPYVPVEQAAGYMQMFSELERDLREVTGFDGVSLQPNSGAQGEYAGLLVIRKYLESKGQGARRVCLIPQSAHGTNPASAVLAGFDVVVVACDKNGNVDVSDLKAKCEQHADKLGALMITYPSTHGVFEEAIVDICALVHAHGGQVYMDGANMNAQVGLCRPGDMGADVCHLNLHKTFAIPHGGGGPGMGPIGVAKHLTPFLPRGAVLEAENTAKVGPVSAAPWGSASVLLISWAYCRMMGPDGLRSATENALLNANYIAARLAPHYEVVYRGSNGRVAHECILDMRPFKKTAGVEVEDIAKRLMDYGFHAPTMSFPIAGTLMIEPTESESLAEIERFCLAMIGIREEIRAVEEGRLSNTDNPLKNAPHTIASLTGEWSHPYTRELAVYPAPWTAVRKFFPHVARVNNAHGDRNLICTCPPLESYAAGE